MIKKYLHILTFLCCTFTAIPSLHAETPEERGLKTINRETAEAHIGFLACDELLGREAGTREGRLAGQYLIAQLRSLGIRPFYGTYTDAFEASKPKGPKARGTWQIHPDSIAALKQSGAVHQNLSLNNILGLIKGKNPDEYVIIGAHYDHLGYDPFLAGDQIYNGADDNASGVSAVLQVARAFLATGKQPKRSVIFAFWDGEEKGLLGSASFVLRFPKIKQVKGYINFDMIGRNKDEQHPEHVTYFYTESHPEFGEWLKTDIRKYDLKLTPDYRPWDKPFGGSDNGPFALQNIPIIWYHTEGHPDYHQPGDHAERINWDKVVDITKSSFLNLWRMANE